MTRLQDLEWTDPPRKRLTGLLLALDKWVGTPYVKGARVPKVGVDCARLVAEVLNDVHGWPGRTVPNYAADPGVTNARESFKVMRRFLECYPELVRMQPPTVLPGDLLVLGPCNGGPYHSALVGPVENTIWTADQRGVTCSGFTPLNSSFEKVFGIFRVVVVPS